MSTKNIDTLENNGATPMLKQYYEVKQKHKDCIVFYRIGDFYETFNEDAQIVSKELGLYLTRRAAGKGSSIPLAGVPHHSSENYVNRLVKKGYKVAICEQLEDPAKAKGIVQRGVIRIITPGTVLTESLLQSKDFNFICAVIANKDNRIGAAFADISTGKFMISEFNDTPDFNKFSAELAKFQPSEYIIPDTLRDIAPKLFELLKQNSENRKINEFEDWKFDFQMNYKLVCDTFKVATLEGFGCHNDKLAIAAAGSIIKYIEETQMVAPTHFFEIKPYKLEEFLIIDADTRRNLELTLSMRDNSREFTLLWAIDRTLLNSGARLLKDWLLNPLIDVAQIKYRQAGVAELFENTVLRNQLREALKNIYDIERIVGKISCKTVMPKDLIALKLSLVKLPEIKSIITVCESEIIKNIFNDFDDCADIFEFIDKCIDDNPAPTISEGGIIKKGFNAEVDEYRKLKFEGKDYLLSLETQERQRSGIQSLKIKFNKVFGYYIEISNANLSRTPENYIRKQTLANCERFITPELKEFETKILIAEEKLFKLEETLFLEAREKINTHTQRLLKIAKYISILDVLQGLAETANQNNYTCPEINDSAEISIKNSRHPVIELINVGERFVENDIYLNNSDNMLQIITGPNMAGKSTYIRQTALLVLLAQIGSFIPASSASIGIVDRIFTRVGASDNLTRGQSTFMVEMIEAANILHNATAKSLIILDEIGRGTSTFDGLSLAWAIAEHIALNIKAKTLFATHYHELIELSNVIPGVKNYNIAVREWRDKIIFLRKIVDGGASRSYGIQVARLAGLPTVVINRAKEILEILEKQRALQPIDDMPLFNLTSIDKSVEISQTQENINLPSQTIKELNDLQNIINEIQDFEVNIKTPIDCMNFIIELKNKISALQ